MLAYPLLPIVALALGLIMPALGLRGMIPGGPIQGVIFGIMLLGWAWAIDRRPLSDYGVSASWSWLLDLVVGFLVVLGVWSAWHALAASVGWTAIEVSMTAPQGALWFGLLGRFASLLINTWVQDTVFFAIVLATAAEGLRAREVAPARAVIGGWIVATVFFTVIHGLPGPFDVFAHLVGGAVFGALYVHTGNLALTIGVHWGSSYAAGTVFASAAMAQRGASVFRVTETLPGIRGLLISVPLYLVTYLVLVGWIRWHRGGVSVETELATWTERRGGLLGTEPGPQGE